MLKVVWDMETQDPDDFLTLLLLLGHPQVDLQAVTVTPGTPEQVGLVRRAVYDWFGRTIPIGAYDIMRQVAAVSPWHREAYGEVPPSTEASPGGELLLSHCSDTVTLITGGPLKNLGAALRLEQEGRGELHLGHLVMQGGFAGEGIVPHAQQLPKFAGMVTCPSFNLNGDPLTAEAVQQHQGIRLRHFVSKNVCHGVIYDDEMHARIAEVKDRNVGLAYIWQGMDCYLRRKPAGKAIHDLVAACCAIDPEIGIWAEVTLYRERGQWGARLAPGSNTWIIIGYDRERFLATLLAHETPAGG